MDTTLENNTMITFRLLKATDVANMLNVSRSFAYQLLETGQIPTVRIGHALRVRIQDLEAFIEASLDPGNQGR